MNKIRNARTSIVFVVLLAMVFGPYHINRVANAQAVKTKKIFTGSFPVPISDPQKPTALSLVSDLDVSDYSQIRIETRIVTTDKELGGVVLLKRPGCEECVVETISLSSNFNSQILEIPGTTLQVTAAAYKFGVSTASPPATP